MFKALNRAFNIKVFNIKSSTWASWSFEIKKYQNGALTEECRMLYKQFSELEKYFYSTDQKIGSQSETS